MSDCKNCFTDNIESLRAGQLGLATISFWEIAMLIEKKRLAMQTELDVWRSDLLQIGN